MLVAVMDAEASFYLFWFQTPSVEQLKSGIS
jgi:hypothetical protein